MKTIKVNCEFGLMEAKTIGTVKQILGKKWIVVNYPCRYMNAEEPLFMRRVVNYETGGSLPIYNMPSKAPAKDFLTEAENFLSRIGKEVIEKELSKYPILNN
jgi:hypothetical protein